jgi:diguanylate cyclase (GGDEF)-like protein
MLSPIEFLRPATDIPYCHHEKWDGSGYPRGLAGEEIPLSARIFTVADIWDALSSDRPYRKAWPTARVLEYIASLSGKELDPAAVETFFRLHTSGSLGDLDASAHDLPCLLPVAGAGEEEAAHELDDEPFPSETAARLRLGAGDPRLPRRPGESADRGVLKVLIADGHEPTAALLKVMLEGMGHEASIVADGREALHALRRGGFHTVIADWGLPVIDGPQLCRHIRGDSGPGTPYVILTGECNGEAAKELPAGADDFLARPIDARDLAARLVVARRLFAVQDLLLDRSIQAERMYVELRHQNERLAELVATDPLTGLSNRRHLLEVLETQAALAQRQGRPLSLAILDVDRFKPYNDVYGHRAGDEVLCLIADILRSNVRGCDVVARYGGEEFIVVMPMTDSAGSREVADRLRTAIAGFAWPLRPITASLGIATADADSLDISKLVDAADQAMYRSKQRGRNRVTHSLDLVCAPGGSLAAS